MSAAVDGRRSVDTNSNNMAHHSSKSVLLPESNTSGNTSGFRKVLAQGENKTAAVSADDKKTKADKSESVTKTKADKKTDEIASDKKQHSIDKSTDTENPNAVRSPELAQVETLTVSISASQAEANLELSTEETAGTTLSAAADSITTDTDSADLKVDSGITSTLSINAGSNETGQDSDAAPTGNRVNGALHSAENTVAASVVGENNQKDAGDTQQTIINSVAADAQGSPTDEDSAASSKDQSALFVPVQPAGDKAARSVSGNDSSAVDTDPSVPLPVKGASTTPVVQGQTEQPALQIKTAVVEKAVAGVNENKSQAPQSVSPLPTSDSAVNSNVVAVVSDTAGASRLSAAGISDAARPQMFEGLPQTTGNHIKMMVEQGISRATVQLHPADLGSMRINIDLKSEQLNVQISVVQGATRDALESALPRLRAQLEADGYSEININLEGGQAGDRNSPQTTAREQTYDSFSESDLDSDSQPVNMAGVESTQRRGLVDLFA